MQESKIINQLKKERFGVIGKPSDWLISSIPNYKLVNKLFGIKLIDIPINEVIEEYKKVNNKYELNINKKFNKEELNKADNVYKAIKSIIKKYKLTGITIRCFDLLKPLKTTACLALAKLNDNKIIGCCEGDITAMISMKIASLVSKDGFVFQANPSRIDIKNNKIVLAHCTIPTKMCTSYKLDTHFESKIGVAIKGKLKKENVTIFRLSSDLKNYFICEGKIIKNLNEENLCRTQIEIKCDSNIEELLTNPCGNHHIVIYGKYKKVLDKLLLNNI